MENVKVNSKVFCITTKGCESCYILDKLIEEALSISKNKPEYVNQDFTQVDKKWLKQNNVTDYPTTFLIKDDIVRYKFVGTRPAVVIARWIDVHL